MSIQAEAATATRLRYLYAYNQLVPMPPENQVDIDFNARTYKATNIATGQVWDEGAFVIPSFQTNGSVLVSLLTESMFAAGRGVATTGVVIPPQDLEAGFMNPIPLAFNQQFNYNQPQSGGSFVPTTSYAYSLHLDYQSQDYCIFDSTSALVRRGKWRVELTDPDATTTRLFRMLDHAMWSATGEAPETQPVG